MAKHIDPGIKRELYNLVSSTYCNIAVDFIRVYYVDFEPYENVTELTNDVEKQMLCVSTLNNTSPLFTPDMNLRFRAVHDYDHAITGAGFDFWGEYYTYTQWHKRTDNPVIHKLLFSEIVLQAAYKIEYGYFPEQKAVIIV